MDSQRGRSTRGRARGNQQPRFPGNQPPRFEGAQPRLPRQPGAFTPRPPSWPRQPAQIPQQIRAPRPQAPRPENKPSDSPQVEQITRGVGNLSSDDAPLPIGRGALRGRRPVDSETVKYFRMPRPESSNQGKQGTLGQPIDLVANYFPITSYTNWTLYQYRVNFSPEEDRIAVKRGLLGNHRDKLGAYIFDGSMLFSSTHYESKEFTLTSQRSSDDEIVTITIIFTSVLRPNDYANIQVFNLLIRNTLRHLNLTLIGRNYFDLKAKIDISRHKLALLPGYESTIGLQENGLMLRAEIITKVMRDESVHDFFRDCVNNSRNNFMDNFKAGVIGSIVLTTYNNQTYKIDDVDETISPQSTFKMKDGSLMSYVDYYANKWNIKIRDRNQPMLLSKKKKSFITRTFNQDKDSDDLIILVPELCSLTGLTEAMRNNYHLMREVADHTRVDPTERLRRCCNFVNRIQTTPESISSIQKWNLSLANDPVKFQGRVLKQQNIYYGSEKRSYESGNDADWTRHVRSHPNFLNAVGQRWVVLYPQNNERDVRSLVQSLQQVGSGMHLRFPQPDFYPINPGYIAGYSAALEQIINQFNPSFILIVVLSQRSDLYNLIKRHLCVNRAVPSQVMLLKHALKINMSVNTKVAIQINCKLGGAPWALGIPTPGIMIIGFDVCHDKQRRDTSFGALIASISDDHTKFYSCVQPHPSGEELSSKFATAVSGALNAYRAHNKNKLPSMVIIYRDGVGDGQISYVHKTEVRLVKEACQNFYDKGSEPPMAFIIVKKRISTRYFCSRGSSVSNPPPGTVVDSVITDPTMYDFFLVSQHVRFGTVTPTHYNVIVDTLPDWSPSKMQMLTYKLTHMYYNWSGTVRVPAHCQLAHKLAFLTAQSLQGTPNPGLNHLLYFL